MVVNFRGFPLPMEINHTKFYLPQIIKVIKSHMFDTHVEDEAILQCIRPVDGQSIV